MQRPASVRLLSGFTQKASFDANGDPVSGRNTGVTKSQLFRFRFTFLATVREDSGNGGWQYLFPFLYSPSSFSLLVFHAVCKLTGSYGDVVRVEM